MILIKKILYLSGNLIKYNLPYRKFKTNSWTNEKTNLSELLFICEVKL